jgi:hypothetical protein
MEAAHLWILPTMRRFLYILSLSSIIFEKGGKPDAEKITLALDQGGCSSRQYQLQHW